MSGGSAVPPPSVPSAPPSSMMQQTSRMSPSSMVSTADKPTIPSFQPPEWKTATPEVQVKHYHKDFKGPLPRKTILNAFRPQAYAQQAGNLQHALKVNWILASLVGVALAGTTVAFVMFWLPCEKIYEPVTQSFNQTFNNTVNKTFNETVIQLVTQTYNVTINQTINLTVNSTVNHTMNVTLNSTINLTINHTTYETVNITVNSTVYQIVNETVNQTIYRTVNLTVNRTVNVTVNQTLNATVNTTFNTTFNHTVTRVSAVDFDGMLLLDESGSIALSRYCGANCKFEEECDLSILIGRTLYNETVLKGAPHFTVGALTWSWAVSSAKTLAPIADIASFESTVDSWKTQGIGGSTYFAPPLATCWKLVRTSPGVSANSSAFKMCMLLSDGENYDSICNTDDCEYFCLKYGLSTCSADAIAWAMKTGMNFRIPAAYLAMKPNKYNVNANNMYCYSSCNTQYSSVADCKNNVFTGNALQDAAIRSQCKFFVDGDFAHRDELERKLVQLARSIASDVSVTTPVTVVNMTSNMVQRTVARTMQSIVPTTVQDTVQETVQTIVQNTVPRTVQKTVQSVVPMIRQIVTKVSNGTKLVQRTVQNVTQEVVEASVERIVSSQQQVTQQSLVQKLVPTAVISYNPFTVTETRQVGVKESGCKDPNFFWLLALYMPLAAYLLYFPIKKHRDILKARYRERLRSRRQALHEHRAERAARVQSIRNKMERARRKAAEAAEDKRKKLSAAQRMAAGAEVAQEEAAAVKAAKEAAKESAEGKRKAAEERLEEVATQVDASRAQLSEAEQAAAEDAAKREAAKASKEAEKKAKAEAAARAIAEERARVEADKAFAKAKAVAQGVHAAPKPKPKAKAPGEKKVFKWNIAANDHYIWATGGGGAAPRNVEWGKLGKPRENQKNQGGNSGLHPDAIGSQMFRKSRASQEEDGCESAAVSSQGSEASKRSEKSPRSEVSPRSLRQPSKKSAKHARVTLAPDFIPNFLGRKSVPQRGPSDPYLDPEDRQTFHRGTVARALSEHMKQEERERAEFEDAMRELEALEDEIRAAREKEDMSAEAAEKALQEIERLKQDQEEEEEDYEQELQRELQLEACGKLVEDGDFWSRICGRCWGDLDDEDFDGGSTPSPSNEKALKKEQARSFIPKETE